MVGHLDEKFPCRKDATDLWWPFWKTPESILEYFGQEEIDYFDPN